MTHNSTHQGAPVAIEPFHIILHRPEIPHNAGAAMRLCAAAGAVLHLIGPLGFRLDAAAVRRAGMDYREWADVRRHDDWEAFGLDGPAGGRLFVVTTQGEQGLSGFHYRPGDRFLFGSEGAGLPQALLDGLLTSGRAQSVRVPMAPRARSLNLANCVAIVLYQALRDAGYPDLV